MILSNVYKRCIKRNTNSFFLFKKSYCTKIRYSDGHTWVKTEGGEANLAKVGISDQFMHSNGVLNVIFVDFLSKTNQYVEREHQPLFLIDSPGLEYHVKSPISGIVKRYNGTLRLNPNSLQLKPLQSQPQHSSNQVNEKLPSTDWVAEIEIKDLSDFNELMDKTQYDEYCNKSKRKILSVWNKYANYTT